MLHSNVLGPGTSPKTPFRLDPRWRLDDKGETASGLGINIPACSSGGLFQPLEVCDPHLHLSTSQLISVVPRATET